MKNTAKFMKYSRSNFFKVIQGHLSIFEDSSRFFQGFQLKYAKFKVFKVFQVFKVRYKPCYLNKEPHSVNFHMDHHYV